MDLSTRGQGVSNSVLVRWYASDGYLMHISVGACECVSRNVGWGDGLHTLSFVLSLYDEEYAGMVMQWSA